MCVVPPGTGGEKKMRLFVCLQDNIYIHDVYHENWLNEEIDEVFIVITMNPKKKKQIRNFPLGWPEIGD